MARVAVAARSAAVFLWLALGAAGDSAVPDWQPLATEYGDLYVREFGPQNGPLVLLIHGVTDNDFIRNEWNPVALRLAESGFHVLIPNFHSAPAPLTPGELTGEVLRELIRSTFAHANHMIPSRYRATFRPRLAVMGKSWGGRMAAEAAALEEVVAAGLVVPAIRQTESELLSKIRGSIAVCLVKDDPVVRFDEASKIREAAGADVAWHVAESGGHRIVPEFGDPLVEFLEARRDSFAIDVSEF